MLPSPGNQDTNPKRPGLSVPTNLFSISWRVSELPGDIVKVCKREQKASRLCCHADRLFSASFWSAASSPSGETECRCVGQKKVGVRRRPMTRPTDGMCDSVVSTRTGCACVWSRLDRRRGGKTWSRTKSRRSSWESNILEPGGDAEQPRREWRRTELPFKPFSPWKQSGWARFLSLFFYINARKT